MNPTQVFSSLPGVCCYYQAVILVWILIMCGGGKIRQSFEGYLQTYLTFVYALLIRICQILMGHAAADAAYFHGGGMPLGYL